MNRGPRCNRLGTRVTNDNRHDSPISCQIWNKAGHGAFHVATVTDAQLLIST